MSTPDVELVARVVANAPGHEGLPGDEERETARAVLAALTVAGRLLPAGRVNLGTGGPISVFPVQSDHGDVHTFHVARSNGDSLTVEEYQRVFAAVTGRQLEANEVAFVSGWFAEEDRPVEGGQHR